MKKLLFVCVIAASFTACNNGASTETKTADSTTVVKVDSTVAVAPVADSTSKKLDSTSKKLDSTTKKMDKKMDTAAKKH